MAHFFTFLVLHLSTTFFDPSFPFNTLKMVFLWLSSRNFIGGWGRSIVMQISIGVLIFISFSDHILWGRANVSEGGGLWKEASSVDNSSIG